MFQSINKSAQRHTAEHSIRKTDGSKGIAYNLIKN
jgi:hypothetical protein